MISSKRLTEYTDFHMPREFAQYPRQDQALSYLRSYAQQFKLTDGVRFGTSVQRIEQQSDGWLVSISDSSAPIRYAGVVIANGHHCQPRWPQWQGDYAGQLMHSSEYKSADALRGRRVLIVGGGNSGCDITVEAAQHAKRAFISLRRGYYVFPKFLFGAPIDRCGATMERWHVPTWLNKLILRACLRIAVGLPKRYGLPMPRHGVFQCHPIVNSQILHHLAHRHVTVKPQISEASGNQLRFEDGTTEELDLVICATGYKIGFPFCERQTFSWEGERPKLFLNVFHPVANNLFVVGMIQPNGGIWQLADYQSQLVARYIIAQRTSAPAAEWFERMKANPLQTHSSPYIDSPRHAVEVDYFHYRRRLRGLLREFDRRNGSRTTSAC
jgi:cation diffusion facilitator CzcD-associated flavoprotein CzcO